MAQYLDIRDLPNSSTAKHPSSTGHRDLSLILEYPPLGSSERLTEMTTKGISREVKAAVATSTPACAGSIESLGASTSWKPKGLSRLVMV